MLHWSCFEFPRYPIPLLTWLTVNLVVFSRQVSFFLGGLSFAILLLRFTILAVIIVFLVIRTGCPIKIFLPWIWLAQYNKQIMRLGILELWICSTECRTSNQLENKIAPPIVRYLCGCASVQVLLSPCMKVFVNWASFVLLFCRYTTGPLTELHHLWGVFSYHWRV